MLLSKKLTVALSLAGLMVIGMAATRPPADPKPPKRNLKVLPKDISHDDLDKIMGEWRTALGVRCNFCHAPSADSTSRRLDFASDAKPEKEMARKMFRMTGKINKKFFKFDDDDKEKGAAPVSCITCHHGNPHPGESK